MPGLSPKEVFEEVFNAQIGPSDQMVAGLSQKEFWSHFKEMRYSGSWSARMANQTVMDRYFELPKETLNRLSIMDCPNRIYTVMKLGLHWIQKRKK